MRQVNAFLQNVVTLVSHRNSEHCCVTASPASVGNAAISSA